MKIIEEYIVINECNILIKVTFTTITQLKLKQH